MRFYNVTPIRLFIIGLVYLWSGVLFGQTIIGRPMLPLNSSFPFPSNLGTRFRWVSEDLATNTPVATWTDRIASQTIIQYDAGTAPTNYTDGIYFNGTSQRLKTSVNMSAFRWWPGSGGGTGAVWIVAAPETPGSDFAGVAVGKSPDQGIYVRTAPLRLTFYGGPAANQTIGTLTSGQILDFGVVGNTVISSNIYYTNGVASLSSVFGDNESGGSNPLSVGYNDAAIRYFKGKILEMCWFTNALTGAQMTSLHQYATNKYGFSP